MSGTGLTIICTILETFCQPASQPAGQPASRPAGQPASNYQDCQMSYKDMSVAANLMIFRS